MYEMSSPFSNEITRNASINSCLPFLRVLCAIEIYAKIPEWHSNALLAE